MIVIAQGYIGGARARRHLGVLMFCVMQVASERLAEQVRFLILIEEGMSVRIPKEGFGV